VEDGVHRTVTLNLRIARLVVADLTEARPNCYYELGVAHALKKQVIHLAYASEELHFDVKDWNFIIYSRLDELADELRQRILGTVGRGDVPARGDRIRVALELAWRSTGTSAPYGEA
jgi:hypothetical protein